MITESQKLEELLVECVIPGLAELTAKQLPYGDKLQVFAGSPALRESVRFDNSSQIAVFAPCVPTWRRIIVSVAQADQVIIALPGDKSKMSIYDKTPPERV